MCKERLKEAKKNIMDVKSDIELYVFLVSEDVYNKWQTSLVTESKYHV